MRLNAFLASAFFAAVLLCATLPALAAGYNPKTEIISKINRIAPLQNPEYDRAEEILGRRLLDRKSKVVGSLKDIVLTRNGNIAFLDVEFDRIQLRKQVFVNYSTFNVRPASNGYAMTFDAQEIQELYPALLADIETAAGEDDNQSLRKIQGLEVWTASGERIGTVSDVLFGANGQRAEAVYVTLSQGNQRGDGVALPFNQVNFDTAAKKRRVTVEDDTAEAMIAYAQGE